MKIRAKGFLLKVVTLRRDYLRSSVGSPDEVLVLVSGVYLHCLGCCVFCKVVLQFVGQALPGSSATLSAFTLSQCEIPGGNF